MYDLVMQQNLTTTNPYEEAARTRKATALVACAIDRFSTATVAHLGLTEHATDDVWAGLANLAGVNVPSAATRAQVLERLAALSYAERSTDLDASVGF
jgi:hypothetical protein